MREVARDTLVRRCDEFAAREAAGGIKGEIVIVIDGPSEAEGQATGKRREDSARVRAAQLKAEGAQQGHHKRWQPSSPCATPRTIAR